MLAMGLSRNCKTALPHLPEEAQQRAPHPLINPGGLKPLGYTQSSRDAEEKTWHKDPRTQAGETTKLGGTRQSSNSPHLGSFIAHSSRQDNKLSSDAHSHC